MKKHNEKFLLDPTTQVVKVSKTKNLKFYLFLAKLVFKKFGKIELLALDSTIEKLILISEYFSSRDLAKFELIESNKIILDNKNKETYKFKINMIKTENFDKLIADKVK